MYTKGINPKTYFASSSEELTLLECLNAWWDKYVTGLKENTRILYKSVVYNTMYTEFRDVPVASIPVSLWVQFFDKQEKNNKKKARVLLLQLRSVMKWCISRQLITSCEVLKLSVKNIGKKPDMGVRVLTYTELAKVWLALENNKVFSSNKLLHQMLLLWGARLSELRLSTHAEFNMDDLIWTTPTVQAKMGNVIRRPIFEQIKPYVERLITMQNPVMFPGQDLDKAIDRSSSKEEAVTASEIRLEADAGPFGIVLRKAKYVIIKGFVEGALANATCANYDYANETAVAVTLIDCESIDITQLGIEAWQGVHLYASGSTVTMNESWTQDYKLLNSTGKHGAFQSMSALTGASELAVLPATNNSYFYALNASCDTVRNITCDMSSASDFANTFLCTTNEANSRIYFGNTKNYFGSSRLIHPLNGFWSNIETINDPYMPNYLIPSGYAYLGRGKCVALDYTSTALASDGSATITPPSGYRINHTKAYLVTSSASQAASGAVTILQCSCRGC